MYISEYKVQVVPTHFIYIQELSLKSIKLFRGAPYFRVNEHTSLIFGVSKYEKMSKVLYSDAMNRT